MFAPPIGLEPPFLWAIDPENETALPKWRNWRAGLAKCLALYEIYSSKPAPKCIALRRKLL